MRITPATLLRDFVVLATLGTLAVAGARVTWHLLGQSGAMAALPAPAAAAAPDAAPPDIGPVLALGPFGARAVPEPEAGPAPETSLDLVLRGVVVRPLPAASSALISAEGATRTFRPGDAVTDRATLVAVEAAQVVLEVDGERQTLSFPEPGGAAAPGSGPGSGVDRLRAAIEGQRGPATGGDDEEAGPVTPDDYIALWRERIRANPAEVLDSIGLIATENGYMIAPEHDSGVARAGLRAGDVVRSVNGQAVGDIERDRNLYDDVAASGQARIEVERDGRTIVMSFPLR